MTGQPLRAMGEDGDDMSEFGVLRYFCWFRGGIGSGAAPASGAEARVGIREHVMTCRGANSSANPFL